MSSSEHEISGLTLWPFSQGELAERKEGFVDACFRREFAPISDQGSGWPDLVERLVAGGFPEVEERAAGARRQAWFGSYLTTILERDVRAIANIQALRGILLYTGTASVSFGPNLHAVPVSALWRTPA